MKPYYEHAGITIYHGDCREILPSVSADVVVTDPPYGIGYRSPGDDAHWCNLCERWTGHQHTRECMACGITVIPDAKRKPQPDEDLTKVAGWQS